jgi:hypothetical protein
MADGEAFLVAELRALAGGTKADTFVSEREGVGIEVTYSGGSSSSITLRVPYDDAAHLGTAGGGYRGAGPVAAIRPLAIRLTPETPAHVAAKADGIDVEHQTGDAAFDDRVYVDTATQPDVLRHVLGGDVRGGVLELLALDFGTVTIDDPLRAIVATRTSFVSTVPPEPQAERALDAFARLARGVPALHAIAGEHAPHPLQRTNRLLGAASSLAFVGGIVFYFGVGVAHVCPEGDLAPSEAASCLAPGIAGGVFGLVAGIVAGLLAAGHARRHRGRSDSSRHATAFAWWIGVLVFALVTNVVAFVVARV